jgi:hypothetical protein
MVQTGLFNLDILLTFSFRCVSPNYNICNNPTLTQRPEKGVFAHLATLSFAMCLSIGNNSHLDVCLPMNISNEGRTSHLIVLPTSLQGCDVDEWFLIILQWHFVALCSSSIRLSI